MEEGYSFLRRESITNDIGMDREVEIDETRDDVNRVLYNI